MYEIMTDPKYTSDLNRLADTIAQIRSKMGKPGLNL